MVITKFVVAGSMHTGEGAFRRERNGKNTSVYLRWNVADNGRLSMNCMVKMDRRFCLTTQSSCWFRTASNHKLGLECRCVYVKGMGSSW